MESFYDEGLHFTCIQCGHCCKDEPGYVFLTDQEINAVASHLSVIREVFLKEYCRTIPLGSFSMVSLLERANNDCIFFNSDNNCEIYHVRPLQCRSYPFWESVVESKCSWDREAAECPGISSGKLHTKEEIDAWIRLRRKNQPKLIM